jgi:CheY-like chemotaxis protein
MKHLFFVEDDLSLINGLSFALKKEGYAVDVARTKQEAEALWLKEKFDLVILDVSLPDGSGYDLCRQIRQTSTVPIIFLTAADEETEIIMGLDLGGDDYITKPFKLAVFLSRIHALLRRQENFIPAERELAAKKNLFLMISSFALSIVLFLSFSVLIDFVNYLMPQSAATSDLDIASVDSTDSLSPELAESLSNMAGVKRVYGQRSAFEIPAQLHSAYTQAMREAPGKSATGSPSTTPSLKLPGC